MSKKGYFPSQVVSDAEKASYEYGLKIARAIENEWFGKETNGNRYHANQAEFHKLRLYARGEQSIEKYKDELSINGDLSYLNLDWKPVPVIPKFVDIVVNGIAERTYDIKAYSQDPSGVNQRTQYMESIIQDMRGQEFNDDVMNNFGINMYNNDMESLPSSQEELEIHMQLNYKQSIEIAEEQALQVLINGNNYENTLKRVYHDLTVIGIGAVKSDFNTSEGVTIKYVDPANLVYSYSESPFFDDIYYCGEVKNIPINELKKQFPHLTDDDLDEIQEQPTQHKAARFGTNSDHDLDSNIVTVLYFNYKTYANNVFKVKTLGSGAEKAITKDDSFNPPEDGNFVRVSKAIEVLYEGALIVGTKQLLKWELAENMLRSKSDYTKVKLNYNIVAPRMYKGKIESLVRRITGFADMIQLTHLKIQQVLARMVPDGVYLDADGLAEVDLGNGTNYNPQEALNMFFQTGSIVGRSLTQEGDMNPGKVPIQEIASGSGGQKLASLVNTYNYYMQMIRDVTGLNEARDGSTPDTNALVGVQKMAAANSNTATRHILQSGLYLTSELANALSLRISDLLEYSPTRDAFIQSVGAHNVATLDELSELYLYDFGIFIELSPDEEEKQLLENNIQMALQSNSIELEDAIDVRNIKNLKLANQVLKIRRQKKATKDQQIAERNIQVQAQANAKAAEQAAAAEAQKEQLSAQTKAQLVQVESQAEMQKLQMEARLKFQLMQAEAQINMRLRQMELDTIEKKDNVKEDRKDERTRIQASQQSELISQRKEGSGPRKFESAGNDILGEGIDLSSFGP